MPPIDLGPDPLALDRQVCFALSLASRSVIAIYRPPLEPHGLTHPQYLVLLALWDRSPRTVRDLGETLRHERALAVQLTDKGRELRKEAEKIPYRVVEELGMELSELEELHAALSRVLAATQKAPGATSPVS
jgi:MarR family transcriptional regulator, organic hydroperoxide resistance regulator